MTKMFQSGLAERGRSSFQSDDASVLGAVVEKRR
jgi:hypothetical protein